MITGQVNCIRVGAGRSSRVLLWSVLFGTILSSDALAQYAEWYLDCTVNERGVPSEIYSHPYRSIEKIKIYMSFHNRGGLNEAPKITYKNPSDEKHDYSPLTNFNTLRFSTGKPLVTGRLTWTGSDPLAYPRGWSMRGELVVKGQRATYSEAVMQGQATKGHIMSSCIFNNPN